MDWKVELLKFGQYVASGFLGGFCFSVVAAFESGVVDLHTILVGGCVGGLYQAGKLILDLIQLPFVPKTTAGKGKKKITKQWSEYLI